MLSSTHKINDCGYPGVEVFVLLHATSGYNATISMATTLCGTAFIFNESADDRILMSNVSGEYDTSYLKGGHCNDRFPLN